MRGIEKRAYEELGRTIRDKNKVGRKQRGLDRMNQKMRRIKKLRKKLPAQEKCSKCGKKIVLESPDTGPKTIDGKPVCDKCWFEALGNEVEKHPLKGPLTKKRTACSSSCVSSGSCACD